MDIVYSPKSNMTFVDFADKLGLRLLIEGKLGRDYKFIASLVSGEKNELGVAITGTGDTAVDAVANLVVMLSGATVFYCGAVLKVPPLVRGDVLDRVRAAVDKYKAEA